jgi:hypothetical protein
MKLSGAVVPLLLLLLLSSGTAAAAVQEKDIGSAATWLLDLSQAPAQSTDIATYNLVGLAAGGSGYQQQADVGSTATFADGLAGALWSEPCRALHLLLDATLPVVWCASTHTAVR